MNPKTVRNATAVGLQINDTILQPTWARGVVTEVTPFQQERTGEPAVLVKRANESDITFYPKFVLTIDRRVVVPHFAPLATEEGL